MSCKDTGMCTSAAICFLDGCQDEIKATTASASEGELLPCHCGGKPQRQERMSWSYWVECSECINETARKGSKREADEEWNLRRATAPSSNAAPLGKGDIRKVLIRHFGWLDIGKVENSWEGDVTAFCADIAALAQQSAAQAIRQVQQVGFNSAWCDVSQAEFDTCSTEKRIVYAAQAIPEGDSFKPVYWFGILTKCARLLDLPTDEPIPSGVLRAVEKLVAAMSAATKQESK